MSKFQFVKPIKGTLLYTYCVYRANIPWLSLWGRAKTISLHKTVA